MQNSASDTEKKLSLFARKGAKPIALGLWLVFSVLLSALFVHLPPSPDHATFDYIGWIEMQGGTLYIDAADQNWPGQMLVHTLSNWMFGHKLWSYRLFEVLIIIPASCLALFAFLRLSHQRLAALLVIPIYQVMYMTSGMWSAGQRDFIAAPLLIVALTLMLAQIKKADRVIWFLVLQGVCIAAAGLIRPTLLLMAPLLTLMDIVVRQHTNRSFLVVIGEHAIVAITIVVFFATFAIVGLNSGSLSGWVDVSTLFNLEVYSGSVSMEESMRRFVKIFVGSFHWYVVWSGVGLVMLWKKAPIELVFLSLILPTTFVSYFIQGKGLGYHLLPLVPVMAILMASAIACSLELYKKNHKNNILFFLACIIITVPIAGFAKKIQGQLGWQRQYLLGEISKSEMYSRYGAGEGVSVQDTRTIADYIHSTGTPIDATILFWGRTCHVYTLTNRRSPIFAVSSALFQSPTQEFSLFDDWYVLIEQQMKAHAPDVILLVQDVVLGGYLGLKPINPLNPKLSDIVVKYLDNYTLEKTINRVEIYRLNKP